MTTPIRIRNRKLKDITGRRYGRLVLVAMVERDWKYNNHIYRAVCDCGTEIERRVNLIKQGATSSCGCLFSERLAARNTTHGLSRVMPREYRTWKDMRARCNNPNGQDYADYGGRGIKVCARWDEFAAFVEDMGPRPDGTTIDRKDVNGDYEPANCRWATDIEQANNRRSNRIIEVSGERMTVAQLSRRSGIEYSKLHYRLDVGMGIEKATADLDSRKP